MRKEQDRQMQRAQRIWSWGVASVGMVLAVAIALLARYQADGRIVTWEASAPVVTAPSGVTVETIEQARQINASLHAAPVPDAPLPPLPALLEGARPDVVLRVDANGHLIPEASILTLFEFYLSALEDEPLDQVLTRIHQVLGQQLQGVALEQARDLLGRYVDYKIALADVEGASPVPETGLSAGMVGQLRQRLSAVEAARRQWFTSIENDAFFALERAQDDYMIGHLALAENPTLTPSQRQQAQAQLELQLPEEVRALRQRVTRDAELHERVETMRREGASTEAIHRERVQTLGEDAAAGLAALDEERARWQSRLTDYARARDAIRRSGMGDADQLAAIQALIQQRFEGPERLRVQALDATL